MTDAEKARELDRLLAEFNVPSAGVLAAHLHALQDVMRRYRVIHLKLLVRRLAS